MTNLIQKRFFIISHENVGTPYTAYNCHVNVDVFINVQY